jgi:MFS family permease
MSDNKTLKAVDRKIFTSYFEDGLLDIFLAAFVLMFAIGPFLSGPLGDFWGTVIFLPFFGLVYLILRYIRKRVVSPKIGSVKWGEMRKRKLRTVSIIMLIINVIFLLLGMVVFFRPIPSGYTVSIQFSVIMLILFTAAGYMLDFNFLYVYGILIALAMPVGEWLYQTAGFSHHGFPVVFGSLAVIMLARGLYKFITLMKEAPPQVEEATLQELNHG